MKMWHDVKLDDESMWPKNGLVELEAPHIDDRGYIQSLVNFPMKNLSLISSKKGAVRSNHYHLTDWHYGSLEDLRASSQSPGPQL